MELKYAEKLGYKVLCVYEVHHWVHWSRNQFAPYILHLFKTKLLASSIPCDENNVPYEFDTFRPLYNTVVADYVAKYGLDVEPEVYEIKATDEFRHDPAKRSLAKLLLNSLWGKLGQNFHQTKFKTFENFKDALHFLEPNSDIEVQNIRVHDRFNDEGVINGQLTEVQYKCSSEVPESGSRRRNLPYAVITTAYGRIGMHKAIMEAGIDNVAYWDTDSIICTDEGRAKLAAADYFKYPWFLGNYKNELPDDDFITDWVCLGPKSYSYTTHLGKKSCAIKGISNTVHNRGLATTANFKKIAEGESVDFKHQEFSHLKKVPGQIKIKCFDKRLSSTVRNKRWFDSETNTTFPYGWCPN